MQLRQIFTLLILFILLITNECIVFGHKGHNHHHHDHDHHHHVSESKKETKDGSVNIWIFSLLSSLFVSLLSFVGASLLFSATKATLKLQFFLSCLAIGSLLGDCFLHLMPNLYKTEHSANETHHHHHGDSSNTFVLLFGFISCLCIELYLRLQQKKSENQNKENKENSSKHRHHHHHSHIKAFGWLNLIGDALHNFMDGAGIAGSFQISMPVGLASVLSICLHEIPQELSDYGILLAAGFTAKKALFFNFLSGVFSVVGCLFGLLITNNNVLNVTETHLIALNAGSFLYISTSMIPEVLNQLIENNDNQEGDDKSLKQSFTSKLITAISGITFGILMMHIIGIYEDTLNDFTKQFVEFYLK